MQPLVNGLRQFFAENYIHSTGREECKAKRSLGETSNLIKCGLVNFSSKTFNLKILYWNLISIILL